MHSVQSPDLGQFVQFVTRPAPGDVLALVALVAATAGLAAGVRRHGRHFFVEAPGLAAIALAAVGLLTSSALGWPATRLWPLGVAALALLVVQWFRPLPVEPAAGGVVAARLVLAAVCAALALFLFWNLGGYAGTMLVWEPGVLEGFGEAIKERVGALAYSARMLLWSEGLVSRGDHSLLYGSGTYAFFHIAGVSRATLRAVAALLAVLCVPALFGAVRQRLGTGAAAAAALTLATSVPLVYYGRYGTSLSGTLLGAVLALAAAWRFLQQRGDWRSGLVLGAALLAATLGYSPVRPVMLAVLAVAVAALAADWRHFGRRQLAGLAALFGVLAAGVGAQVAAHTAPLFVSARGEQLMTFLQQRDYIVKLLGRDVRPENLTLGDKLAVAAGVLRSTLPELGELAEVTVGGRTTAMDTIGSDPPRLPYAWAPFLPLLLWGLGISLRRAFRAEHATLLAWAAAAIVPALLTTRFDAHRALLVAIPLAVWTGMGFVAAAACLERAGLSRRVVVGLAAAVVAAAGWCAAAAVTVEEESSFPYGPVLRAEIAATRGPVVLAADLDHREVGEATLALVERTMVEGADAGGPLEERVLRPLAEHPSDEPYWLDILLDRARGATLLIAPAERFAPVAAGLRRLGACVVERGPEDARFWRVTAPSRAPCPQGALTVPPEPPPTPTPALAVPDPASSVPLTTLQPLAVEYGFAPPRIDATWEGGPLSVGGVKYARGIGMHAWCRMKWPVPPGAVVLQALVGLDRSAADCPYGLVTFEVRSESDEVLWASRLVGPHTAPEVVRVPVRGLRALTLVVTEGGNGRDCDHADWVEPTFLLAEPPASPPPRRRSH